MDFCIYVHVQEYKYCFIIMASVFHITFSGSSHETVSKQSLIENILPGPVLL